MGRKTEIKCPACSYQVLTSAGPDSGFISFTNTYVCLYCNSLIDIVTGDRNDEDGGERNDPLEITSGHQCPKCLGNRFVIWDSIERLCPRCKTKMTNKLNGPRTMTFWD